MFNFLHNFTPDSVLFSYGFLTVHWYGVFVVSGIVAGLLVTVRLAKRFGITSDEVYNLGFYVIIFGLAGARVYSVLLDWQYYISNPAQVIAVWNGGLAIQGAIVAGTLTLFFYLRKKRQSFWRWFDLGAPAIPLGQAFGRWGNYFNQEIFGRPTDLPWGIPIELQNRPAEYLSAEYFHPTFLYESILNLINFAILLWLFKTKVGEWPAGAVGAVYLINYSLIRIAMEFLRTDSVPEIFGLRSTQLASVVMLLAGVGLLVYLNKAKLTGRSS
jgi:phosphatidylglycerol:prolipoprotein diacylglycerol transferase